MQYDREVRITGDGGIAIQFPEVDTPLTWRVIDSDGRSVWMGDAHVRTENGWHRAVIVEKDFFARKVIES